MLQSIDITPSITLVHIKFQHYHPDSFWYTNQESQNLLQVLKQLRYNMKVPLHPPNEHSSDLPDFYYQEVI